MRIVEVSTPVAPPPDPRVTLDLALFAFAEELGVPARRVRTALARLPPTLARSERHSKAPNGTCAALEPQCEKRATLWRVLELAGIRVDAEAIHELDAAEPIVFPFRRAPQRSPSEDARPLRRVSP